MGLPAEPISQIYASGAPSSNASTNLPVGSQRKFDSQSSMIELSRACFSNTNQNNKRAEDSSIRNGAFSSKQESDGHRIGDSFGLCIQNFKTKQEHQYSSTTTYYNHDINTNRQAKDESLNNQIDKMLLNPPSTTFEFERQVLNETGAQHSNILSSQSDQQSSRSSSSTSLSGIEGNILMSIEQQSYEHEEYLHDNGGHQTQPNNQRQQRDHIPSLPQPLNGLQRQHSDQYNHQSESDQQQQQHQQQQHVSSQIDHQLVISNHNSDFLTYNYNEHENVCSDGWPTMALDSHSNNNCSSQGQSQIDSSYNCDSPFRMASMSMNAELSVDHQRECAIQAYSHPASSNTSGIVSKNLDDFNNNQNNHQLHNQQLQSPSFSNLAPLSGAHSHQDRALNSYCMQSNNQDQFFPNSTFYTDMLETDSSNYNHQQYHHNGYVSNGRREFETSTRLNDSHQNQSTSTHIQCRSPTSSSVNLQPPCYNMEAQTTPTVHRQVANNDGHSTIKPPSAEVDQYDPRGQLYQTNPNLMEVQNQMNYKQNGNSAANQQNQQQQPPAFEQTIGADQYQMPRSAYTSLQQLTMNCDNYANQVSTTTATLSNGAPNQSANKARALKGRRGRPRKKGLRSKNKVNGKLWEFIRDLLLNDHTNPSFIRWERREDGVFKFVQSDKVAKMWGERKQNPKMTYEKLSRAMRYYYKSKVLLPVFGRRLVYKFGPNATGWLPEEGGAAY